MTKSLQKNIYLYNKLYKLILGKCMKQEFTIKKDLRIWAKRLRKNIDCSDILVKNLMQTEEYKNARHIMIFYPKQDEVNLLSLLEDESKIFYLPKINKDKLLCCQYSKGEELCNSCFGTCEPLTNECHKEKIDLVIVPALCCDKNNYRLGYGGGFYDRFLEKFFGTTICCLPNIFIVDTIFPEKHDKKIDLIITDSQDYRYKMVQES